ncbi:MAG: hypothetical protein MZV70_28525 [Desulfobacterales bacterium]|nr:hypothetical protein [Desulfobacterales bacterium]
MEGLGIRDLIPAHRRHQEPGTISILAKRTPFSAMRRSHGCADSARTVASTSFTITASGRRKRTGTCGRREIPNTTAKSRDLLGAGTRSVFTEQYLF